MWRRNFVDYKSRKLMSIRKFRRSRKKLEAGGGAGHPRGVQTSWKQVQELAPLGTWPYSLSKSISVVTPQARTLFRVGLASSPIAERTRTTEQEEY